MNKKLESLQESLEHTISTLQGILNDVTAGSYTKEQATLDVENLIMTDGIDYISALSDYAEDEE